MACLPGLEDYLYLSQTLLEMVKRLMDEDEKESTPRRDAATVKGDTPKIVCKVYLYHFQA